MPFRGGGVHPIEFGQKKTFNTNKNGDPKAAAGDAVVVI